MTTIIRACAAHDFLALVPVLAGYRPARSLVCVAFDGSRTSAVLRYDLPDPARADDVVASLLGTLCRIPSVDGIVPIAYGERPFDGEGLPQRDILERVVERAERAGFVVRDALTVAPNGWGSLFDAHLPTRGRALRLIEESGAVSAAWREVTELAAGIVDSAVDLVRIPEPTPALAARIRELLDGMDDLVGDAREGTLRRIERALGDAVDPIVLVERIAAAPGRGTAEELAWLLELAAQPAIRDAIMLQAAFGPVVGELALDSADEACRHPRVAPVHESVGGAAPDAPGPDGKECGDGVLSRLMLGRSTIRPDADRVRAILEVLATAIANAPTGRRTGALCIAAWLSWALGRGSAAGAFIDIALSETPDHTMAGLLHRFLALGELPEWAFSTPAPGPGPASDDAV
ncbi:DUF4192 family protein [Agromyces binzhouensis]|uniref:DUF4192 family protein n=1 Tax=Agromyces binzhouensis TaxID=1817495 RepID=UPI00362E3321